MSHSTCLIYSFSSHRNFLDNKGNIEESLKTYEKFKGYTNIRLLKAFQMLFIDFNMVLV